MNNRLLFTALIMACFFLNASAQFSNSNYERSDLNNDGWNTIFVEWSPYNHNYNAFAIGYSRAFSLTENAPIYIEPALAGQCFVQYHNNDYGQIFASIKAPVNVLYKIDVPNSQLSFMPFAGLMVRYNVWGKNNMFDYFKRFQTGWQAGIKTCIADRFIIGASYGSDFSEIGYYTLKSANISLGVAF